PPFNRPGRWAEATPRTPSPRVTAGPFSSIAGRAVVVMDSSVSDCARSAPASAGPRSFASMDPPGRVRARTHDVTASEPHRSSLPVVGDSGPLLLRADPEAFPAGAVSAAVFGRSVPHPALPAKGSLPPDNRVVQRLLRSRRGDAPVRHVAAPPHVRARRFPRQPPADPSS